MGTTVVTKRQARAAEAKRKMTVDEALTYVISMGSVAPTPAVLPLK